MAMAMALAGCSTCVLPTPRKLVSLVMTTTTSSKTHKPAAAAAAAAFLSINSKLANCQASTTQTVRTLAVGPIIANALLLATPLQALAETCEADQSILNMNMPLLLLVALIGAAVGGLVARQRKGELQRLNEQLRQINAALKRQAKIESYAPALSYAPTAARVPDSEVIVDPKKQELISRLKNGKNFLRNQNPENAYFEFKAALELAQSMKDPIEEKKAARGLGASLQRQGRYKEAIKYHSLVLQISEREGEDSGNTEAFGAIADCYTELGDLEKAASFYDQYIARLQAD
ncbi:protein FLUORESCENT IN BLUE LIGHT, chloroplastic-like [Bidens hawaiensis]|uniref:protein FLUORESCENT IN BLUE LIGHT, chloroplastic-like n=1 Tax=Bidens hawaiensis TaxID=980011 RepID=UPI004049C93B